MSENLTLTDLPEEVIGAAHKAYNAALAPRDTTFDPHDAMWEAVVAAVEADRKKRDPHAT